MLKHHVFKSFIDAIVNFYPDSSSSVSAIVGKRLVFSENMNSPFFFFSLEVKILLEGIYVFFQTILLSLEQEVFSFPVVTQEHFLLVSLEGLVSILGERELCL